MNKKANNNLDAINSQIEALSKKLTDGCLIDPDLYLKYQVNRGLRDVNGKGVLTGLTEISEIVSKEMIDGKKSPVKGSCIIAGMMLKKLFQVLLKNSVSGMKRLCICFSSVNCLLQVKSMIFVSFCLPTAHCRALSCVILL